MRLEERVRHLEKANRRQRTLLVAFGMLALLILALGAAGDDKTRDVVRARQIQVVDDQGNTMVKLWSLDQGSGPAGVVSVSNAKGVDLGFLISDVNGDGSLVLNRQSGLTSTILGMNSTRQPMLALRDAKGAQAVTLGLDTHDIGSLSLSSLHGDAVALGASGNGDGHINLFRGGGGAAVQIGLNSRRDGAIELYGGSGASVVSLGSSAATGDGLVQVWGGDGRHLLYLGTTLETNEALIRLFGPGKRERSIGVGP